MPIRLPRKPEARPSIMRSTPHIGVEIARQNTAVRLPRVFFGPSWRISMRVVADEEVRSAFFRTLSSTPRRAEPGNKATTLNIMQTNALSMRYAQQRAFSPKKWLDAKSEFFTRLCERTATHREVLRAHAAFGSIGFAAIVADFSPCRA